MVMVRDIILLFALAAFLIWFDTSPARGVCVLSHCTSKATTRTYITNTHRQIVEVNHAANLFLIAASGTKIGKRRDCHLQSNRV